MQQWLLVFGIKISTVYIWLIILKKHVFAFHYIFHHLRSKQTRTSQFRKSWTCWFRSTKKFTWRQIQGNIMRWLYHCTVHWTSCIRSLWWQVTGCAIASQVLTKFVWNIASHEGFVNPFLSIIPVVTMALSCHPPRKRGINQISWCFSLLTKITMPFGDRNLKRIA